MATTLPSSSPIDDGTLRAIQVLALAVQREKLTGVVELTQTADALSRAFRSRDHDDLECASLAFRALDGDLRGRIAQRAQIIAHTEREDLPAPRLPATLSAHRAAAPTLAPGRGQLARRPPPSASLARRRLMSDIAAPEIAPPYADPPSDEEILPFPPRTYDGPPPKWWE